MCDNEAEILEKLHPMSNIPSVVRKVKLKHGPTLVLRPAANKVLPISNGVRCSKSDFIKLLHVLKNAHQLKICHRDVKPENIFKDSEGNIILNDWGSAAIIGKYVLWAGTLWFYNQPETEKHYPQPADDLIALVRTAFLMHSMIFPPDWSRDRIEHILSSSSLWSRALKFAESCDYDELRDFFNNL